MKQQTSLVTGQDHTIAELHLKAQEDAKSAVISAVRCGVLLNKRRATIAHGEWEEYLARVDIPKTTAFRYMKVAEHYENKMITDGSTLIDLFREIGVVKQLEGGGQRKGKSAGPDAGQLFFDFNIFSGFMAVIDGRTDNPFLTVDKEALKKTREDAATAIRLIDEALVIPTPHNETISPDAARALLWWREQGGEEGRDGTPLPSVPSNALTARSECAPYQR